MEHSLPLVTTLVMAFSLALVFGFIAERFLKSPALIGYLLAGIACSGNTPGAVADLALAQQLSEIGVILLMFGVGLHFSMKDLLSVKRIAVPGAVLQMTLATLFGMVLSHLCFDWHWGQSFVFGLSLSCASTVVLLKALEARGILTSGDGRIAVGWLVVEDIATVLILVLLPPLAGLLGAPAAVEQVAAESASVTAAVEAAAQVLPAEAANAVAEILSDKVLALEVLRTLVSVAAFVAIMLIVGRKALPWMMAQVARTGSRELFVLFVLAAALGVAYGAAAIFNVSFALGAFFAGMVMRESSFSHRAATESLPLQDAFSVLFFVGVGMLFDWHILLEAPLEIVGVLFIVLIGKSAGALFLVVSLHYPLSTALTVSAALSQIGEFSFILAGQATDLGLANQHLMNLVVAASILSIAVNPMMFAAVPHVGSFLMTRFHWAKKAALRDAPFEVLPEETEPSRLYGQSILVGEGAVLERVARELKAASESIIVVTKDVELAHRLSEAEISVLHGDASEARVMAMAHGASAGRLLLFDATTHGVRVVETARALKPTIPVTVVARTIGIWADVDTENVRFLSIETAAVKSLCTAILAAHVEGVEPGEVFEAAAPGAGGAEGQKSEEASGEADEETLTDSVTRAAKAASETAAEAAKTASASVAEAAKSATTVAVEKASKAGTFLKGYFSKSQASAGGFFKDYVSRHAKAVEEAARHMAERARKAETAPEEKSAAEPEVEEEQPSPAPRSEEKAEAPGSEAAASGIQESEKAEAAPREENPRAS